MKKDYGDRLNIEVFVTYRSGSAPSVENRLPDTTYASQRHVQEFHSGFVFQCLNCQGTFNRRNYNHKCTKNEIRLQDIDVVASDGSRGDEGFQKLREWKAETQPKLIKQIGGRTKSNDSKKRKRSNSPATVQDIRRVEHREENSRARSKIQTSKRKEQGRPKKRSYKSRSVCSTASSSSSFRSPTPRRKESSSPSPSRGLTSPSPIHLTPPRQATPAVPSAAKATTSKTPPSETCTAVKNLKELLESMATPAKSSKSDSVPPTPGKFLELSPNHHVLTCSSRTISPVTAQFSPAQESPRHQSPESHSPVAPLTPTQQSPTPHLSPAPSPARPSTAPSPVSKNLPPTSTYQQSPPSLSADTYQPIITSESATSVPELITGPLVGLNIKTPSLALLENQKNNRIGLNISGSFFITTAHTLRQ
ncbi:hypothetical protein FSP39_021418 [Pinctada imbricata]|uniref:Uncharacterized protein n=1 Tax=Pinctada imbricata TaxID=66713 RepID=A0AA88Y8X2_PINIB|nr:hypothetical protein FSP39_021418 [Pinctada imbricata]